MSDYSTHAVVDMTGAVPVVVFRGTAIECAAWCDNDEKYHNEDAFPIVPRHGRYADEYLADRAAGEFGAVYYNDTSAHMEHGTVYHWEVYK